MKRSTKTILRKILIDKENSKNRFTKNSFGFSVTLMFVVYLTFLIIVSGCDNTGEDINYREEMRHFVENISSYARSFDSDFIVVPQNGHELVSLNGEPDGEPAHDYLNSITGIGREDLYYGYTADNVETPLDAREEMIPFLDMAKNNGKVILVTDYCSDPAKIDDSYAKNNSMGYISFAADSRGLDKIPNYPSNPYNKNQENIHTLSDVKNFLYLINPDNNYSTKDDFIAALQNTDYDLLIIDLFFNGNQLTASDLNKLKIKKNGGSRLVICYMSIGEAEDYRYYWKQEWNTNPPDWIVAENPEWEGNYKVKYWDEQWQSIIFGNEDSYLYKIISSGFDGVYLDIIDAYEYFE